MLHSTDPKKLNKKEGPSKHSDTSTGETGGEDS
ncbi:hypothetical protein T09_297 [Trichinella sp. T9]|nr:hypothetical protein T09_297 [Trichinella sp. T9]